MDGNVKRVLARVFLVEGWYGNAAVSKTLWKLSREYTPKERTGDFNQAMMDLGAGICNRSSPMCEICPLTKSCEANLQGKTAEFPHRKPKKTIPTKQATMLLAVKDKEILLHKRPPTGIWGGLWSMPEIEETSQLEFKKHGQFKHTFSHYHLKATVIQQNDEQYSDNPIEINQLHVEDNNQLAWHNINRLKDLALPTPIKKYLFKHINLE